MLVNSARWLPLLVLAAGCSATLSGPGPDGGPLDASPADASITDAPVSAEGAGTDAAALEAGLPCLTSAPATWNHQTIPSQTGIFRITFAGTPSHANMDGVTGLSAGPATGYDDLAVNVRFSAAGEIDARDGAVYVGPTPPVTYSAGTTYLFRLEVDVPHGLYSAFVTEKGGAEQTIGTQLKFRDAQQGVTALDSLGVLGNQTTNPAASHEVCGAQTSLAASYCGNGVQEGSESCDDGACCDPVGCTLLGAAAVCRPAADACDVAESCDGAGAACPTDVPAADGTACGSGGQCQGGVCAGSGEILRVDFNSQPLDGYTQADLESDFEVAGLTNRAWSNNHDRSFIVGSPAAYSGRSLRGTFLQGIVGGAGAPLNFMLDLLTPYEELYVSYRVKFDTGFDFVKGGKLPGVGGGAHNTGGYPPSSTDPEGFSVRMMWKSGGAMIFYVYHADQPGQYGENFAWKCGGQDCLFKPGTWHTIEQRIVMNTAGQNDGIIQGWFDGTLAVTVSNLRFRDVKTAFSIDAVLWSNFFGGNTSDWAPTKDEQIYFDDFVLSKSPITH